MTPAWVGDEEPTIEQVEGLGARRLAEIVVNHCQRDEGLYQTVRIALAASAPGGPLVKTLATQIDAVCASQHFYGYRESSVLAQELDRIRHGITEYLLPAQPLAAAALLGRLIRLDATVYERSDDSDGVIGDAIGEAVTDCGRAWAAVPERDPKILAAEVFDLFTTDEYGARSEVITARHGELDSAVRHKLPLLCVISLNGGWTAKPERNKPGRDLGYTRYDKMAEAFGCYAEYVEDAEGIRPGCSAPGPKSKRAWWSFSTLRPITAPAPRPSNSPAA